ncbi:MAG: gluconate 5-dehydrogenase [Deltaproteobacteria bacterium]|nr:gluconate 5-dehydrogenase [Deltaproteobacteria bacterium]
MAVQTPQLFDLTGKTALVTGGGRGIGKSMALGLAEAGADVVIASRKLDACEEVAKAIEAMGRRAWAIAADVSKLDEIERLVEEALGSASRIDILVNNAAFAWGAPMLEHTPKAWDRVFDLNLRGLFFLTQRVAGHMVEAGGGNIIHISSMAALRGVSDALEPSIAYNASKGALHTLTRDMAIKLAPDGIRVNAIAPGAFDTSMFEFIKSDPERRRAFLARMPVGRVGNEDDAKGAVVYLASEASAFVTGQILVVDGGWSVQTS